MALQLEHSNTAPDLLGNIKSLLYNKKIPAIRTLFVDESFISDYCKKANLFNNKIIRFKQITWT